MPSSIKPSFRWSPVPTLSEDNTFFKTKQAVLPVVPRTRLVQTQWKKIKTKIWVSTRKNSQILWMDLEKLVKIDAFGPKWPVLGPKWENLDFFGHFFKYQKFGFYEKNPIIGFGQKGRFWAKMAIFGPFLGQNFENEIFLQKSENVTFIHSWSCNFVQESRKTLWADSV